MCRAGAGDVLERNVARLFRERVTLFEEIQLTQPSLMSGKRTLIRACETACPVFLRCLVLGAGMMCQIAGHVRPGWNA